MHRDDAPLPHDTARRAQRGRDLGGVMGVIVVDADPSHDAVQLESPLGSRELLDASEGVGWLEP